MAKQAKQREFTGKHMAMVMVGGFGIVMAVNFYMASLATGGFHGIVVDNSYVASQKFNTWLEEARKDDALGWSAALSRDETGHVIIATEAVPENAQITADLRRPIGTKEFASLTFAQMTDGTYRSDSPVNPGRWTVRLAIDAAGHRWDQESELR